MVDGVRVVGRVVVHAGGDVGKDTEHSVADLVSLWIEGEGGGGKRRLMHVICMYIQGNNTFGKPSDMSYVFLIKIRQA